MNLDYWKSENLQTPVPRERGDEPIAPTFLLLGGMGLTPRALLPGLIFNAVWGPDAGDRITFMAASVRECG